MRSYFTAIAAGLPSEGCSLPGTSNQKVIYDTRYDEVTALSLNARQEVINYNYSVDISEGISEVISDRF